MLIRDNHTKNERPGAVLLAVVVVVVLMSLAAYQYSDLAFAEMKAADNAYRMAQAKAAADSGVHLLAALLSSPEALAGFGGNPYDNDGFQMVSVTDASEGVAPVFQIIAPPETPNQGFRFGATDEASKINLNMLLVQDPTGIEGFDILMGLPNMTTEVANSILDWMDPDSEPREGGAESDFYSTRGYSAKNGPFESIEELMFVKGVTRELLYGSPVEGIPGLTAYVTIYTREQRVAPDGQAFIQLNQEDLGLLYDELKGIQLSDEAAKFIALYRRYGPSNSRGRGQSFIGSMFRAVAPPSNSDSDGEDENSKVGDLADITEDDIREQKGKKKIRSIFDLVDTQVSVSSGRGRDKKTTVYQSPFSDDTGLREELPKLFTYTAVDDKTEVPARVNVNTASIDVLTAVVGALPSGSLEAVDAIANSRPDYLSTEPADPIYDTPAWLISEADLNPLVLKDMERYITTRTQVYRVQVLGHFQNETTSSGPVVHLEAVIDTNGGRPRTIFWRDITELGKGPGIMAGY